jgi:endogenous inhibitor of DNA gyrase (YacG/DUF329 family)
MNSLEQIKPCVVCGKPQVERFRPFCSRRCADVDLHRWLAGAYAVPSDDDDDEWPPVPKERS